MKLWIKIIPTGLFLILFFTSCKYSPNENFVRKYDKESFENFKNTTFFIRSVDDEDGIMIFAYDYELPVNRNIAAYIIDFDTKSKKIKSTNSKLIENGTNFDKDKLEKLVFVFAKYPICLLSVDSNNNVSISLKMNARPDLIRFSDLKFKTIEYKDWQHIKDNWYQKK